MGQMLLLATNRKSHGGFQLADLQLTFAHSNGQGQGHPHMNISKLVTDRVNIAIGMNEKVEYELSISVFKFYIGSF